MNGAEWRPSPAYLLLLLLLLAACAPPPAAVLTPAAVASDVPLPKGYSPQQLQEDLQVLHTTLEEAHPGLYFYDDKAPRDAQFDAVLDQLDRDMTDIEFYRLIAPLVAGIHDAHTVVWPSARSVIYAAGQGAFLPLRLRFIGQGAYVAEVLVPDSDLARGTQVLSINGLPMTEILDRLLPFVPHDGRIETGKYFYLGKFFPMYYGWVIGPSGAFELRTRNPLTGEEAMAELPAIAAVELSAHLNQESSTDENLNLQILGDESIAIMTIRWFGDPGIETFFESSFSRLRALDIRDLVIDLRGNGGGNGHHGAMLYSYLADGSFRYYDHLGVVLDGPLTYLEYTDMLPSEQSATLREIERTGSGDLRYPHWKQLDEPQENQPNRFAGNVYFLFDGGSGSSTTEFAAVAHYNARGIFVGQETGGTYYGNNSGTMPMLTLPNTGVMVVVPLFQFVMAVSGVPTDRGIVPDYPVEPTIADLIAGIDTQLDFTLDLIRRNR
jgi:hypothetical protein